jgi:hypothetical protein
MRVILEIMSGPSSGQKSVLGAFQTVQVGRTEKADLALPNDGRISSLHFALETDAADCYLKDLGSRNGTSLNGRRLTERTTLRSDDEIIAGTTIFHVHIDSDSPNAIPRGQEKAPSSNAPPAEATSPPDFLNSPIVATPAIAAPPPLIAIPPAVAPPPPVKRNKVSYTMEPCASDLVLCSGSTADINPTDLANLLSVKIPLHLIVDPRKIEAKPAGPVDYLFNWLPAEAAPLASPIVVSAATYADWPTLLEQGWGNDAVVCLFSAYEKSSLMEHLRNCLRAKPKQTEMSAGIVGYCWPNIMSMLLAHGMHNFVQNFFTGIEAVLIELPDLPEIWQIYGPTSISKRIDELGFARGEPRVRV